MKIPKKPRTDTRFRSAVGNNEWRFKRERKSRKYRQLGKYRTASSG